MSGFVLRIFDFVRQHRLCGVLSFFVCTAVLVSICLRLNCKEDITDFLPLDGRHGNAMRVFQDISGTDRIFVLFGASDGSTPDPETVAAAIGAFVERIEQTDTCAWMSDIMSSADMGSFASVRDFVYSNIPYFLTETDYARFDSLLACDDYVVSQLRLDKQMLMLPSGGLMAGSVARDPLNLFAPILQSLSVGSSLPNYEVCDGYIFTPDMRHAVVMATSPFGSGETERNGALAHLLRSAADSTALQFENLDISVVGGPIIAVDNAHQIKTDSVISIILAVTLILSLLFVVFRNMRNLLLIALSIGWGWLFGLGCLSLVHDTVSVIVIGISSVVLGIAVNYPLHLIAHLSHAADRRSAVREIVGPLVVGNITTVGAFMALVPLKSVALRDLGLFASFLLVGTIIFVLLYLPHAVRAASHRQPRVLAKAGSVRLEEKRWIVWVVALLTPVFAYFSLDTEFDTDMSNINYVTAEQRHGLAELQTMMRNDTSQTKLYVVSTAASLQEALDSSLALQDVLEELCADGLALNHAGCSRFLCSEAEQSRRLRLWDDFVTRHGERMAQSLHEYAAAEGFNPHSFASFTSLLSASFCPQSVGHFSPLATSLFSGYLSSDSVTDSHNVVDVVNVSPNLADSVLKVLSARGIFAFDVAHMNGAIAGSLSSDFNYIGWTCALIVFFFLYVSFGSFELALISFVPMAVSWVWILGIMSLLGIKFNIVNVILATFIFGQGDDYTIFMTEGAVFEYAHRRKILASYKNSIIVSALVMFIGVGTLIVARHPALRSLAEVTIVGMSSVVLMAYLFPPLLFNWLVRGVGGCRHRPLSMAAWLRFARSFVLYFLFVAAVSFLGAALSLPVCDHSRRRAFFRRAVSSLLRIVVYSSVSLRDDECVFANIAGSSVYVDSEVSSVRSLILLSRSSRLVPVVAPSARGSRFLRSLCFWLGGVELAEAENSLIRLRMLVDEGCSFVVVGVNGFSASSLMSEDADLVRVLAEKLGLPLKHITVCGAEELLCAESLSFFDGEVVLLSSENIVKRGICADAPCGGRDAADIEIDFPPSFYRGLVVDRYRYKGASVVSTVRKNIAVCCRNGVCPDEDVANGKAVIVDDGYGEKALLYALLNPHIGVTAVCADDDRADLLRGAADGIVANLSVRCKSDERKTSL